MANHPIFAPVFHGDVAAIKDLLEVDSKLITMRDAKNLTPLHVAASRGHGEVIELLLDYGANVSGPTESGDWTPLVFASYRGHVDAAKILIENGAGTGIDDGNPIHYAGQRKHRDICRLLVEHGAIDDLIDADDDGDILRLFRAAYSYDADTVAGILTRHPELVDSTDSYGRTPLHEACAHGDIKTVRVLLEAGADPAIQNNSGETPADRASAHRQHAVLDLLDKLNHQEDSNRKRNPEYSGEPSD